MSGSSRKEHDSFTAGDVGVATSSSTISMNVGGVEYRIIKPLGEGGFAFVHLVEDGRGTRCTFSHLTSLARGTWVECSC